MGKRTNKNQRVSVVGFRKAEDVFGTYVGTAMTRRGFENVCARMEREIPGHFERFCCFTDLKDEGNHPIRWVGPKTWKLDIAEHLRRMEVIFPRSCGGQQSA